MPDSMINFGDGSGRLGRATQAWIGSLRERRDLPGSALVLAELARDAADLADGARDARDGRLYLSAASRLQVLMERAERGAGGDRGAGAGDDGDGLAGELGADPE